MLVTKTYDEDGKLTALMMDGQRFPLAPERRMGRPRGSKNKPKNKGEMMGLTAGQKITERIEHIEHEAREREIAELTAENAASSTSATPLTEVSPYTVQGYKRRKIGPGRYKGTVIDITEATKVWRAVARRIEKFDSVAATVLTDCADEIDSILKMRELEL